MASSPAEPGPAAGSGTAARSNAYIAADVLGRLVERYVPDEEAAEPNVIARVVQDPWPLAHGERTAWPAVAAIDLLERGDDARARRVAQESSAVPDPFPAIDRPPVDGERVNAHL